MRMHVTDRDRNRPTVRPEDLLYHEQIGALMSPLYMERYKRSRQFLYGAVSYLKLIDEGKLPMPDDEQTRRDLEVYREASARYPPALATGGER